MYNSKNTLILKYGLIAVLLCLIISIFLYLQFFLDEPVFLIHYYDLVIHENSQINLHLIANSSDKRRIQRIKFPQMPKDFAYIELDYFLNNNEGGYYHSQKFSHYKYNELALKVVSLYDEVENNTNEKSVELNKAVVYYNNGDKQEVDIGRIILHKNLMITETLTSTFVQRSEGHKSTSRMISNDNFIIESIASDLDEELNDIFELKMDGSDVKNYNYPINITTEDSMYFESQFKFESEDIRRYNVYNIQKRISLINSKGSKETMRIYNLTYWPFEFFTNESGIIQYLKEIGVR